MKEKKLIVFDLDGTITESKEVIDDEMAKLLNALLPLAKVGICFDNRGSLHFNKKYTRN